MILLHLIIAAVISGDPANNQSATLSGRKGLVTSDLQLSERIKVISFVTYPEVKLFFRAYVPEASLY